MAYKPLLNTFIIKGTVSNTYIITNQTHVFTETIKICLKKQVWQSQEGEQQLVHEDKCTTDKCGMHAPHLACGGDV